MIQIKHQQQLTPNSCVSACIAMLLGIDGQKVFDDFHFDYKHPDRETQHNRLVHSYLLQNGLSAMPAMSTDPLDGTIAQTYLLCVPSINIPGENHQIIYQVFQEDGVYRHQIFDPNEGREGKKYYITSYDEITNEFQFKLKSFSIDFIFDFVEQS